MEQKRLQSFDIAKGIGIILMIIGHCGVNNQYLNNFIYSFHMPLFFIISGYFFKHRDDKECVKRNFKKLIIPYIITCISIILFEIIKVLLNQNYTEILGTAKTWFLASLYGSGGPQPFGIRFIGAIWFLWALFFALYFINITSKTKYQHIWVILISYVGYKTSQHIWLPLSVQAGMAATIFVYLGTLARKHDIFNKKVTLPVILSTAFVTVFCTIYCGKLYMVSNYYENGLLDIIGALSASFLCIKLSQKIENRTKFIKKVLVFIGENGLICLCLHLFALNCLNVNIIHNTMKNIGIEIVWIRCVILNFLWIAILLPIIIKGKEGKIWENILKRKKQVY